MKKGEVGLACKNSRRVLMSLPSHSPKKQLRGQEPSALVRELASGHAVNNLGDASQRKIRVVWKTNEKCSNALGIKRT
jgi:hypothetical protein